MPIEREFKFTAESSNEPPDVASIAGIVVRDQRCLELSAIYYDTPSFSLARAGVTLRARTGEPKPPWTLKLPGGSNDGALSRTEHVIDAPLGPVPPPFRLAVAPFVRTQPLAPVVRLHTHRVESTLSLDGRDVATLVDDAVTTEDATSSEDSGFREIEIELVDGATPKDVRPLIDAFREAGFDSDRAMPKVIRSLGRRATEPPDVTPIDLDRGSPAGAVAHAAIARSVGQLVRHHGGVVLAAAAEDVHQFRVATRRLRSDLRTFAPLLERGWTDWLRAELKWLGGEVGAVRDADVLHNRLVSQLAGLPEEDRHAAGGLLERLGHERADARSRLVEALATDRYSTLVGALVDAARLPPFTSDPLGAAYRPATEVVDVLVRKRWKKLRAAAEPLTSSSSDVAFHQARIRAKQTRYAAEAVAPVFGRRARRFAKAVESIQSVLGEHQDTAVAERWLRDAADAVPDARLVVGELITVERLERQTRRAEFASLWPKVSKHKVWDWLD